MVPSVIRRLADPSVTATVPLAAILALIRRPAPETRPSAPPDVSVIGWSTVRNWADGVLTRNVSPVVTAWSMVKAPVVRTPLPAAPLIAATAAGAEVAASAVVRACASVGAAESNVAEVGTVRALP